MAITEKQLDNWAKKHELKKLHSALKAYDYKIRLHAIKHLAQINNRDSLPHLEALIDDAFLSVIRSAAAAIKMIRPEHPALRVFLMKIHEKEVLEENQKARTEENFEPASEEEEYKKLKKMAQKYSIRKIEQEGLAEERRQMIDWKVASIIAGLAGSAVYLLYYYGFI